MGKGYFFLLTTLSGRGWNMAAIKKWAFFLAPKIRISARKSVFSYGTAFFGKVALVTLGVGSVLAPSDLVCDFSFPSYVRFR